MNVDCMWRLATVITGYGGYSHQLGAMDRCVWREGEMMRGHEKHNEFSFLGPWGGNLLPSLW